MELSTGTTRGSPATVRSLACFEVFDQGAECLCRKMFSPMLVCRVLCGLTVSAAHFCASWGLQSDRRLRSVTAVWNCWTLRPPTTVWNCWSLRSATAVWNCWSDSCALRGLQLLLGLWYTEIFHCCTDDWRRSSTAVRIFGDCLPLLYGLFLGGDDLPELYGLLKTVFQCCTDE